MKLWVTIVALFLLVAVGAIVYLNQQRTAGPSGPAEYVAEDRGEAAETTRDAPLVETLAQNLEIPWEVVFLPDGELLITERPGTLLLLKSGVEIVVPGIEHVGEGGLLGAVLHPEFIDNQLIYLYQTTNAGDGGLKNRVVRYVLDNDTLTLDTVIFDDIPGAQYHDGGRVAFGPDGYLYVTVGDATTENRAQDPERLEGSILRITADGDIPPDNPFGNAVWSYGHRNPQGIDWDEKGNLWSTEHGRSGALSGFDELNLIWSGANYGWPIDEGDQVSLGADGPIRHSGSDVTWAPGDVAYHDGSVYIPGLRGETLYEAVLEGTKVVAWHEHFVGEFGRLRTVNVGPDGLLYLTTSNRDGRDLAPNAPDDLLLRVNPDKLLRP